MNSCANPSPEQASCEFETRGIYGLEILDPEMSLQGSERPEPVSMTIFFRSQGSGGQAPAPPPFPPTRICFQRSPHPSGLGAKLSCPQRLSHFNQNKTKLRQRDPSSAPTSLPDLQLPAALTAPTSPLSSSASPLGGPEGPWLWFSLRRPLPLCTALTSLGNVGARGAPCRAEA